MEAPIGQSVGRSVEIRNFPIRKWKPCFSRICQKVEDWLRLFSRYGLMSACPKPFEKNWLIIICFIKILKKLFSKISKTESQTGHSLISFLKFRQILGSCLLSGKKSKSVFDFLTYSRETWFSFSYGKVSELIRLIGTSKEIDRVSKFDNSLSFGAKQNAKRQIFFELWIFQSFFTKNSNRIFFDLFEHKNTRKHVPECSCSLLRVLSSILAHLAHLAQFLIWF